MLCSPQIPSHWASLEFSKDWLWSGNCERYKDMRDGLCFQRAYRQREEIRCTPTTLITKVITAITGLQEPWEKRNYSLCDLKVKQCGLVLFFKVLLVSVQLGGMSEDTGIEILTVNKKTSELKGTSNGRVQHPHLRWTQSTQCPRMNELVAKTGIRYRTPGLPSILRHSFLPTV